MVSLKTILEKYGDIIKEEVNVKEIDVLSDDIKVKILYVPEGAIVSKKFGKDTNQVIKNAKEGNIKVLDNGKVKVFSKKGKEWILEKGDYKIRYEGLDDKKNVAAYETVIVKLDLDIDENLLKEGIARQISRFLNQMRKDANYNVEDRIVLYRYTDSDFLKDVMNCFSKFLTKEVLLKDIEFVESLKYFERINGDIKKVYEEERGKIHFCLKK